MTDSLSETPEPMPGGTHTVLAQLMKTALFALILFLLARLVLLPYEVDGRSMSPNLVDSERVLVNRAVYSHFDIGRWLGWVPGVNQSDHAWYLFHAPERGDVLVLNPPLYSAEPYIKRVVATAGERVNIQGGSVYVNDQRLTEPYITGLITECDSDRYCDEFTVPAGTVYVLGDNRDQSYDSRSFGPVPLENVIGKAWFSNWPIDRLGPITT
jgi:signal peptidase I